MYHIGKVIEIFRPTDKDVFSSDKNTQATCEMWDENIITFLVSKNIEKKLKIGQYVLVSYRPIKGFNPPVPEHEIIKILPDKKGQRVWDRYKEMFQSRKRKEVAQNEHNYIA
jgi:hydrogenase maturation factor